MAARGTSRGMQAKSRSARSITRAIALEATSLLTSRGMLSWGVSVGVARALEAIVKGVRIAQTRAKSVRIEVICTPQGKVKVNGFRQATIVDESGPDFNSGNERAISAAQERGKTIVHEILSRPEMLTGDRFAELVGMEKMAVNKRLKQHRILGLESAELGVRFPDWQLAKNGRPVPGLSEVLSKFGSDSWEAYRFLLHHHAGLGKLTALEALRVGKKKLVLEVAETFLSDGFS